MIESVEESRARYMQAGHAMQSGIDYLLRYDEKMGTPKDLRVGVNSSMSQQGGLATLLIAKGVFTEEEYGTAMADAMEREVEATKKEIKDKLGVDVELS